MGWGDGSFFSYKGKMLTGTSNGNGILGVIVEEGSRYEGTKLRSCSHLRSALRLLFGKSLVGRDR